MVNKILQIRVARNTARRISRTRRGARYSNLAAAALFESTEMLTRESGGPDGSPDGGVGIDRKTRNG